ncbi:hypothetical protein KL953_04100 [Mycolicibacterium goodii]|uniref:hypothetical protein n=1 Tax=Mycolicibacterium goodii TaxID=134601 RepID=UPI001BDCEE47|nr:hypothetical protein [Mycolicibacterium goodii]MBU8808066.1 hypothetical protein [Mycolicibacterium goodii]
MTEVTIQLWVPEKLIAVGNSRKLILSRTVGDDDPAVRVARAVARAAGLELAKYDRPGTPRAFVGDDHTMKLLSAGQKLVASVAPGTSFEMYTLQGEDYPDDDLKYDDELGPCYVEIPGVCSVRSIPELGQFLARSGLLQR